MLNRESPAQEEKCLQQNIKVYTWKKDTKKVFIMILSGRWDYGFFLKLGKKKSDLFFFFFSQYMKFIVKLVSE